MNEDSRIETTQLYEVAEILRAYKKLLVMLPILALVMAAVVVAFFLRPTWEAVGVIEIGRLGRGEVNLIEPVNNVIARMGIPSFGLDAAKHTGSSLEEQEDFRAFYSTLKVAQVKGTNLIEVKLRGPSSDAASKMMLGVIENLKQVHGALSMEYVQQLKDKLASLSEEIRTGGEEVELLRKKLFAKHEWNAFDATLSATLLKDKSTELRGMRMQKLELEGLLETVKENATNQVGEVSVSNGPVSPRVPLILGLAFFFGLFGAVMIAFVHHALTPRMS